MKNHIQDFQRGDIVESTGGFSGFDGVITDCRRGSSVEDHGMIEVLITKITKENRKYGKDLRAGDVEHFTYFGEIPLKVVFRPGRD